jgi:hypothetical protein
VALINVISKYHDGTLHFADLIAPHNQTRPLTYRAIYLFNAIMTDWDIRSEYVYMYASIYSLWALHIYALWRVRNRQTDVRFLLTSFAVTIFLFSPVGHNNHWWSMMLQLNLANLLIAAGLLNLAFRPDSWSAHILSAVLLWLASYTLTNGIFAIIAVIVIFQLGRPRPLQFDRFVLFWIANLACLAIVYLPGIPLEDGAARPTPSAILWFALVYLGNPVMSLLRFPYQHQFDLPETTIWNGAVGGILVGVALPTLWRARSELIARRPAALVLFLFSSFAVISALATAWGRAAFDQFGVANANASRYSIFAVYLTLGLAYYYAERLARVGPGGSRDKARAKAIRIAGMAGAAIFSLLATVTYVRAIAIYDGSHDFNNMLANAYVARGAATDFDLYIFPDPAFRQKARAEMYRLGLGPYRARPRITVRLASGQFTEAMPLTPGMTVSQRFTPDRDDLNGISLQFVTWGRRPSSYNVDWTLYLVDGSARQAKASGHISMGDTYDWQTVTLQSGLMTDSADKIFELELKAPAGSAIEDAAGLPLYAPKGESRMPPATVDSQPNASGATLGIMTIYDRD